MIWRFGVGSRCGSRDSLPIPFQLEIEMERSKRAIDLADIFHRALLARGLRSSYVKIVLSTDLVGSSASILSSWIERKFQVGGVPEAMKEVTADVKVEEFSRLGDVVKPEAELLRLREQSTISTSLPFMLRTLAFFTMVFNEQADLARNQRLAVLVQSVKPLATTDVKTASVVRMVLVMADFAWWVVVLCC